MSRAMLHGAAIVTAALAVFGMSSVWGGLFLLVLAVIDATVFWVNAIRSRK